MDAIPGEGRLTVASWERHPKVSMSLVTERRLNRLAEQVSVSRRKVSPMQIATQILQAALVEIPE